MLLLIRHTRPEVPEGVCYGVTDLDVHAPEFEAATAEVAATVAARLAEAGHAKGARLVTSPLTRCAKLAEALADATGLLPEPDPRLREMHFGRWENRPWSEIPHAEVEEWRADFLHARPHGGESVAMLAARADAALAELRAGPAPCLVVTHMGIIKAAAAAAGRGEGWRAQIPYGAVEAF